MFTRFGKVFPKAAIRSGSTDMSSEVSEVQFEIFLNSESATILLMGESVLGYSL